jgi:hypothetical protein
MLIFVVARSRVDRYEELHRQFGDWGDVRIILDRRRGERRTGSVAYAGRNRRQRDRRWVDISTDSFVRLGWSMVDTEDLTRKWAISPTTARIPEGSRTMLHYPAIRSFLSNHHGYYCEECLAVRLDLSEDETRRSLAQRTFAEVAMAYRICQSCLNEKAVFALRMSA